MVEVSVVIPTYNRAGSIIQSVKSVLRQSFEDIEVIVVDDCSSDDTVDVLSRIEDQRLRVVVHDENAGAGAARNTGIRESRGEYVAFQDSDDEWLPEKLAKQLSVLGERGADWVAVYCGLLIVKDVNQREGDRTRIRYVPDGSVEQLEGDLVRPLVDRSFISTQTLLVRRDALEAAGQFDESLPALEDWDYILRIAQVGKIAFVDEPLVLQRFSADSITRSEARRVDARVKILNKLNGRLIATPRELNRHYYSIAGGFRRVGDYGSSIDYIGRCLRSEPFRLKYWVAAFYILFCRLTDKQPEASA